MDRARAVLLAGAVLFGAGLSVVGSCRAPGRSTVVAEPGPALSRVAPETVKVPDLSPGPPPSPSRRSSDVLWREAGRGDVVDLERLANREGALGLLDGVSEGRDVGLTALLALPHADDAELALARLCAILGVVPSRAVLSSVHGIVARLPEPTERLDPGGMAACGPALSRIAAAPDQAPADRDLAQSALVLIAEHAPR
jgi:hypothetical protein